MLDLGQTREKRTSAETCPYPQWETAPEQESQDTFGKELLVELDKVAQAMNEVREIQEQYTVEVYNYILHLQIIMSIVLLTFRKGLKNSTTPPKPISAM